MNKIPQQKVVTKNGKTFVQTYHVKPDNASSAAVARALGKAPELVPQDNFEMSHAAALALKQQHNATYGNSEDFVNAFERSYEFGETDKKAAFAQYVSDNDPDEIHSVSFYNGFRAGEVAVLGKDKANYLIRSRSYSTDFNTGRVETDMSKKVMPHNPFIEGETIIIPAGTPFLSMNPKEEKIQHTEKDKKYEVKLSMQGNSDAAVGWLAVRMPEITVAGPYGWYQSMTVTSEILDKNNRELEPGYLGRYAETAFRGETY